MVVHVAAKPRRKDQLCERCGYVLSKSVGQKVPAPSGGSRKAKGWGVGHEVGICEDGHGHRALWDLTVYRKLGKFPPSVTAEEPCA